MEAMQILHNENIFRKAAELIQRKWNQLKNNEIDEFFYYFKNHYL